MYGGKGWVLIEKKIVMGIFYRNLFKFFRNINENVVKKIAYQRVAQG